jgi:hypothetical protein
MKHLLIIAAMILTTGCLGTKQLFRGPGSTTYEINVDQRIEGIPVGAKTTISDKGDASGGIVINIVPVGDSVVETADDNSAAKNATSETTPTVKVTPK